MKTRIALIRIATLIVALLGGRQLAVAYYDPAVQRWVNKDPVGEIGFNVTRSGLSTELWQSLQRQGVEGLNPYEITRNDGVDFVDLDGRGVWSGIKNDILKPIGNFIKENWGKLSIGVTTVCLVGPIYNCAQLWKAAGAGAEAYRNKVERLNNQYGDESEWPPQIQQLMQQWRMTIIKQEGQAAAACFGIGGTSGSGGPLSGPGRL